MPHYLSIYLILSHSPLSQEKGGWDGICIKCPLLIYLCTCTQTNWSCHMTFLIFFFFEFIPYFIRPEAPGFHVDSTQNAWEGKGCPTPTHSAWIHMESMWNPCRIHGILMDSRQSCSAEFPRIPWNLHGIRTDSAWIPCRFLAGNTPIFLPTGMPGIHMDSMEIPHRFRGFRAE